MKVPTISRVLAAVTIMLVLYIPATAQQLTFTGQILTTTVSKSQVRRFNIKLYPPKASGKPILVTTSDAVGRFKFAGLSPMSNLLEIYLGTVLVYQEVINITKDPNQNRSAEKVVSVHP